MNTFIPFNVFISDMMSEENPVSVRLDWDVSTVIKTKIGVTYNVYTCDTIDGAYEQVRCGLSTRFVTLNTGMEVFYAKVSSNTPDLGESALSAACEIPHKAIPLTHNEIYGLDKPNAHPASSISIVSVDGLTSGTVQGAIAEVQSNATSHNHDELYEPINSNIQEHIADTDNPHEVTPAQIGAPTTEHNHTTTHINNLTVENNEILNDTTTEGNITFKNFDRSIKWPSITPGVYDEVMKYGPVSGDPSVVTVGGANSNYIRLVAGGKETVINNAGQLKIGSKGGTVMGGEIDIVDDKPGDGAGGIGIASYRNSDMWGSYVYGIRYRGGDRNYPTPVQTGDSLMEFGCLGWDGTSPLGGGELMWVVDGPVSAGVVPARAELYVTKLDGTTTKGLNVGSDLGVTAYGTVSAPAFAGNGASVTNVDAHTVDGQHASAFTPIAHASNVSNPHAVTATQVGLGNVLNVAQIPATEKNAANGVCPLDSNQKVPIARINDSILGNVQYQGLWAAATNLPTLPTPAVANKGYYWICSNSGTQFGTAFTTGDWVVSNGTSWDKVDNTDAVSSVFGRTSNVVASSGDYNAGQVTNTPAGGIAAVTVQAALNELDGDKEPVITKASAFNKAYTTTATDIKMNGVQSLGSLDTLPKADHVHPTDTTREPVITKATAFNKAYSTAATDIKMNGVQSLGVLDTLPKADHVHPTDTTREPVITTLAVSKGGTGAASLTGLAKGNGTGAFSAAVAGTDYVVPSGSISGNSANVTGIVTAAHGGTGVDSTATAANRVLASPSGTAGAPTFRSLVAADVPTLNQNTTGNAATSDRASKTYTYTTANLNDLPALMPDAGMRIHNYSSTATNTPITLDNANAVMSIWSHPTGGSGVYGKQLAFGNTDDIYIRKIANGVFGTWSKLYHSGNTHTHGTYDRATSTLTGGDVFSDVVVADGIVTGASTRTLTAANVGAAATAHAHGSITSTGYLGTTAAIPLITGTGGIIQAGSFGTADNSFCEGNDSRLSNARTPTAHASTHGAGQSDAITITEAQVTNLTTDLSGKAPTNHATNASTYGYGDVTNAGHVRAGTGLTATTGTLSVNYGSTSTTACSGNDARLSDARTPTAHAHGNITTTGYLGTTAAIPLITGTGGIIQAGSFGTADNSFCEGNDSRLSNARTPTAHASTHGAGQSDAITITEAQVTNLTTDLSGKASSTHAHGNITTTGYLGTTAAIPLITGTGGIIQAGSFGTADNSFCEGNDSRLSNARTPTAHASTHGAGQSDAITITEAQVTNLTTDLSGKAPTNHATNASTYGYGDVTNAGHVRAGTGLTATTGTLSVNYGSTSTTACSGNDARLSDARTPTAHAHGNITTTGYLGTTAAIPLITGTGGIIQAGSFGTADNSFCEGNDSRLSNARTPTAHASTHGAGQSDAITITEAQVTNLTTDLSGKASSTHAHGNITTTGYLGTTAAIPLITGTGGIIQAGSFGTADNSFCEGNDSRLSNARTPTAHASTHGAGQSDAITITEAQVTNLTTDLSGKAPTSHAVNASTYGYGDATNAGHVRAGTGLTATTGTLSVNYGTTSTTACVGNDARLSDARTPTTHTHGTYDRATALTGGDVFSDIIVVDGIVTGTSTRTLTAANVGAAATAHAHGSITSTGYLGTTAAVPLITGTGGIIQAGSFGTADNSFCEGNDSRLSNARTPTAHTHAGSDITTAVASATNATNATSAANATNVHVSDNNTVSNPVYLMWGNSAAFPVNEGVNVSTTKLSFVPSTGVLTASGGFVGNVSGNCSGSSGSCTGNAATATTATNANNIYIDTPASGDYFVVGSGATGDGNIAPKVCSKITTNPGGILKVTNSSEAWLAATSLGCSLRLHGDTEAHDFKLYRAAAGGQVQFQVDSGAVARLYDTGTLRLNSLAGAGVRSLYATADGDITTTASDSRLKKNIEAIDPSSVISKLKSLRGVMFNWNTDIPEAANNGAQREIGMIAQEVETVIPEVVGRTGTEETGYKTLDYAKMVAFLTEVCKKQQETIEALEARVAALEIS